MAAATAAPGSSGDLGLCRGVRRAAAVDGRREIGFGQPEVSLRVDGEQDGVDLVAGVGQQLERVGDHAVVGQQGFLLDLGAQRNDVVAVVPGDVVVRAVGLVGGARFRAHVDGFLRQ